MEVIRKLYQERREALYQNTEGRLKEEVLRLKKREGMRKDKLRREERDEERKIEKRNQCRKDYEQGI